MHLFLGIDIGTSYFKAGLFDESGQLQGLGREWVEKQAYEHTFCELPVEIFWSTLTSCIRQALWNAKAHARDVAAISYSSQANSFLLLDEKSKPLTPLVLWPDKRARGFERDLIKDLAQKRLA